MYYIVLVCIECIGMYCMYVCVFELVCIDVYVLVCVCIIRIGVYCLIWYVLECIVCIGTSCIFGRVSSEFTLKVSKYTPILTSTCQSVLYIPLLLDTYQSIHDVLTQDYACIALY